MGKNTTGWRWRRPERKCPWWCASDHQCTAQHGYPSGEHNSGPMSWNTRYGRLTAARTERITGDGWLDIRVVVRLADDVDTAHRQASRLAVDVDLAIRGVLGVPVPPPGSTQPGAITPPPQRVGAIMQGPIRRWSGA
ncbi:hypothetical protein [Micromonospora aurantiaca (nom. illeg.)]|uniref:hypothetical protein n=1 Tax=Micromonospora aurantiaca (nom. illeg.) TaxID=47850 RepID=UPI0008292CF1|nr:hypothetical protein [Micromonospora aurantiaca]SCL21166.1 hypothetical protein GA0070615_0010 [Micromonospora aurantiaca]